MLPRTASIALACVLLSTISGCAIADQKPAQALKGLRNEEIEWQGMIAGLQPIIRGENAKALLRANSAGIDQLLVDLLSDENQFAAAHVLLSLRHDRQRSTSGGEWNGMVVDLLADGSVRLQPSQRWNLKRMWGKRLGLQSR